MAGESWRKLNVRQVERTDLCRSDFLENYRYKKPVVAAGAARNLAAFERWDLDYLESKIGNATIQVSRYQGDPDDYGQIDLLDMKFSDYLRKFREPGIGDDWYWFNIESFWANAVFGASANEELAALASDFEPAPFVKKEEAVYAQIVLGGASNATRLHYDWGGEAKTLAQLKGSKHVLLVHPNDAVRVGLASMFAFSDNPSKAQSSFRHLDIDAHPIVDGMDVWEAKLQEGDVIYWPSFWMHDIVNQGNVNLAVNIPLSELPMNPLLARHAMATIGSEVALALVALGNGGAIPAVLEALRHCEKQVLEAGANFAPSSTLWHWQPSWHKLRPR